MILYHVPYIVRCCHADHDSDPAVALTYVLNNISARLLQGPHSCRAKSAPSLCREEKGAKAPVFILSVWRTNFNSPQLQRPLQGESTHGADEKKEYGSLALRSKSGRG